MVMGKITWIAGPDAFQRKLALEDVVQGRHMDVLESPEDKKEVDNWLRAGSLFPRAKILKDPGKFNRQDEYPDELASYQSDLIILTEDSFYGLTGVFYKRLAKVSEVVKCEYLKEYTDDLVNFIIEIGKRYNLTVSGVVAEVLVDMTGGDLWHIDSELRKLSYMTLMPTVELTKLVGWQGGGFSVDAGDLVRGNWRHFAVRSSTVDSWQMAWRLIEYLVRLLEFHQIVKVKGSLQGSRLQPRMIPKYESELRYCQEPKVIEGLRMLAYTLRTLHQVDSKALIYYNISRWLRT